MDRSDHRFTFVSKDLDCLVEVRAKLWQDRAGTHTSHLFTKEA